MKQVAVVIPCRNEEKYIKACIDSVCASDFPHGEFEILVCDGFSDDNTRSIIQTIASADNRVRLIDNPERTTPFALNHGIRATDAEVVIILGAHAEVDQHYLRCCYEFLRDNPAYGCVGGLLENIFEDNISESIARAMSSPFGVGNAHFRTGARDGDVDTVAFGAYRRNVFEKAGLFDEELVRNQDDEFNYRIKRAGFLIRLSCDIRARYFVRASYSRLLRQYYQYGYWKVFVNRKHGSLTTVRQLAPPIWILFLLMGIPAAIVIPFAWIGLAAVSGLYFMISWATAIRVSSSVSQFFGVCLAFYILHAGYGWGYLEGIFKFMILRKNPGKRQQQLSR